MSNTTATLNDILAVLRDGVEFYSDAKDEVKDPHLVALFGRIKEEKQKITSDLESEVVLRGEEPEDDGTFAGTARQAYAHLRAAFGSTNKAFVAELEEHEDRILEKVEEVLSDNDTSAAAKRILEDHKNTIKTLHDEMADLKKSMAA